MAQIVILHNVLNFMIWILSTIIILGPKCLHAWSLRCIIWFQLIHDGLYIIGFDQTMKNSSHDPSRADYNNRAHKSLLTTCYIKNSNFLGNPSFLNQYCKSLAVKNGFMYEVMINGQDFCFHCNSSDFYWGKATEVKCPFWVAMNGTIYFPSIVEHALCFAIS